MEKKEKNRIDGFNDGYRLNLYNANLYEKLKASLNNSNEYEAGIMEGALEAENERERQRMKQLEDLNNHKGKNKDKEDIER